MDPTSEARRLVSSESKSQRCHKVSDRNDEVYILKSDLDFWKSRFPANLVSGKLQFRRIWAGGGFGPPDLPPAQTPAMPGLGVSRYVHIHIYIYILPRGGTNIGLD